MVLSNKDDTDERPSLIRNYNDNYFTVGKMTTQSGLQTKLFVY